MNVIQIAFSSCQNAIVDEAAHEIVFQDPRRPIRVRLVENGFVVYSKLGEHTGATTAENTSTYRGQPSSVVAALRPLRIVMRRQTRDDSTHIAKGIAAEYQTGDKGFDEQVFLDTLCESETLQPVLNERVRHAVSELFRQSKWAVHLGEITIDDEKGRVIGAWQVEAKAGESDFHFEHASALIASFRELASAIPELVTEGQRPVLSTVHQAVRIAHVVMLLGLPVTAFIICGAANHRLLEQASFVHGLAFSAVTCALLLPLSLRLVRGQPNSADLRGTVAVISIWFSLEIGFIAAHYFH